MSKKISDFFKIEPKFELNFHKNQENSNLSEFKIQFNIKNEKEEHFDINLDQIKLEKSSNYLNFANLKSKITSNRPEKKKLQNQKRFQKITNCKMCNTHLQSVHSKELQNLNFHCEICNRKFISSISIQRHMTTAHPNKSNNYECDIDGKVFSNRTTLYHHMKIHESKVKCTICHVDILPRSMTQHIKDVHTIARHYQCKICTKSYKSAHVLKVHIRGHNKTFECKLCLRKFSFQSILNKHIKEFHENPKSFKCEFCDNKFNTNYEQLMHQKFHDKSCPKSFKCQRCDFTSDLISSYKKHQKVHERQDKKFKAMKNPIKCQKCPTLCKDKKALWQHNRIVHSKLQFQCDLCGRSFKCKSHVVRHIKATTCMG